MLWAKRRFKYAEYAPDLQRLADLQMMNPSRYSEFLMVSKNTGEPGVRDYYLGVPATELLRVLDGWQEISDTELPKDVDTILLADTTKEPFISRFKTGWSGSER
jgi:hypothetical protein